MTTTFHNDFEIAWRNFCDELIRAFSLEPHEIHFQKGSKTNGNSWKVRIVSDGWQDFPRHYHWGYTRRDFYERITAMTAILKEVRLCRR